MDRATENVCLTLKVAARFAARPMKPERMTALLLKLRKGAGTSLQMKELDPVFAFLGGWKIDEVVIVRPEYAYQKDEPRYFSESTPVKTKELWEKVKHNEVKHLPDSNHVKLHQLYYTEVTDLAPHWRDADQLEFHAKVWQGQNAFRIIAPNHKTFDVLGSYEQFLSSYATNNGVFEWLKKETPFHDQINEKLGLESYEVERQKAKAVRIRDNTGTCPCCFRNVKLNPKAKKGPDKSMPGMTLHGYKRPGFGYIHSNCFGEDWAPFELSNEGSIAYLKKLDEWIESQTAYLQKLMDDKVELLYDGKTLVRHGTAEPHLWARLLKEAVGQTEFGIKSVQREYAEIKKKSDAWKLEPLPVEVGA